MTVFGNSARKIGFFSGHGFAYRREQNVLAVNTTDQLDLEALHRVRGWLIAAAFSRSQAGLAKGLLQVR